MSEATIKQLEEMGATQIGVLNPDSLATVFNMAASYMEIAMNDARDGGTSFTVLEFAQMARALDEIQAMLDGIAIIDATMATSNTVEA